MEKVLDPILKNLPNKMSLSHWRVGPMQGDFQVKNDLRASELHATAGYGLMDEQVAVATAAAAAAMAMEHEQQNKPRYHRMGHVSNHERLRAFAATLPQQRERMGEVFQELRQRAPEMIQEIRQRTPVVIKGIQERTPVMIKGIQQRGPEVIQGIKEYVREHVLQRDELPAQDECDASGRKIYNSSYYDNSLNEGEQREQPPLSSYQGTRMQMHCNQAWKKLYQPSQEPSEFYVNFEDGNAQDAVNQAMGGAQASKIVPVDSGYANMNDPLDVSARHPPMKLDPAEQPKQQKSKPVNSMPKHVWGTKPYECDDKEKEGSACEEPVDEEDAETPKDNCEELVMEDSGNKTSLHSTTKYHWGAPEKTSPAANNTVAATDCSQPQKMKPDIFVLSGNEDPTDDDSSSSDEDHLIDQSSPKESPVKQDLAEEPHAFERQEQPQKQGSLNEEDSSSLQLEKAGAEKAVSGQEQQDLATTHGKTNEDFDA